MRLNQLLINKNSKSMWKKSGLVE